MQYVDFINDLERGLIKIPQFQRDFVWTKENAARLLDSIVKGFPIGTFILWKTNERLRSIRNIGELDFPATPEGDFIQYVLDGQQRMTSLYAGIKGCNIIRKEKKEDYSEIYVDLDANEDGEIVTVDISRKDESTYIKVTELLNAAFTALIKKYNEKQVEKIEDYRKSLTHIPFQQLQ